MKPPSLGACAKASNMTFIALAAGSIVSGFIPLVFSLKAFIAAPIVSMPLPISSRSSLLPTNRSMKPPDVGAEERPSNKSLAAFDMV